MAHVQSEVAGVSTGRMPYGWSGSHGTNFVKTEYIYLNIS